MLLRKTRLQIIKTRIGESDEIVLCFSLNTASVATPLMAVSSCVSIVNGCVSPVEGSVSRAGGCVYLLTATFHPRVAALYGHTAASHLRAAASCLRVVDLVADILNAFRSRLKSGQNIQQGASIRGQKSGRQDRRSGITFFQLVARTLNGVAVGTGTGAGRSNNVPDVVRTSIGDSESSRRLLIWEICINVTNIM
uniref:Uncharacterized protein n=1 Tax=Romanomermis culicivorax TaxID=13658 RepID=A0A915L0E7_ROMCU